VHPQVPAGGCAGREAPPHCPEGIEGAAVASLVQDDFRLAVVIRRSLAVLRDNILPFGILFLIINAPSSIYAIKIANGYDTERDAGVRILELVEVFLGYLATAAVTYATIQELRGHRVGFREFCARGLAQGGVAIRVALLSAIGFFFGFIALVVPAFVLYVMWWVAIPVAVIERGGAIDSLRRSTDLTKGYRWKIFGLMLAFFVAAIAVGIVVVAVGGVAVGLLSDSAVLIDRASTVAVWVWLALFMAAQAVLTAVSYYYLRVAKEGVGIEEIATVFD
jgi:hypothetical protein